MAHHLINHGTVETCQVCARGYWNCISQVRTPGDKERVKRAIDRLVYASTEEEVRIVEVS